MNYEMAVQTDGGTVIIEVEADSDAQALALARRFFPNATEVVLRPEVSVISTDRDRVIAAARIWCATREHYLKACAVDPVISDARQYDEATRTLIAMVQALKE